MTRFDRRTYLKGALIAASGVAGIGGTVTVYAQSQGRGPPDDGPRGGRGNPGPSGPQNRGCPAGTTQLATYETSEEANQEHFVFESGVDDITFTNVTRNGDGEITGFEWTSGTAVAVVAVTYGPNLELFEGGFEGTVDLSDERNAIGSAEFCAPRGGRAVLCLLDQGWEYSTEMHFDGDPDMGGREGVLHVTSDGTSTMDYGHSMVNVVSRLDERVTLGELDGLTFDYYEGGHNGGNVPDEVFVTLLTPGDELKLAVRTIGATGGPPWREFDVLSDIENNAYSVLSIGFTDLQTSELAQQTAVQLRDHPDERVVLTGPNAYRDATLVGVGVGAGNTRADTVIDRYYDDLTVEWGSNSANSESFDFPATVPLDVVDTFTQGNFFIVALELRQAEAGLSLADAARGSGRSVKLNPFGAFTPPIERGVPARAVRLRAGRLEAAFPDQAVEDALDMARMDRFIVSGDFDVPSGSAFFGVGEKNG